MIDLTAVKKVNKFLEGLEGRMGEVDKNAFVKELLMLVFQSKLLAAPFGFFFWFLLCRIRVVSHDGQGISLFSRKIERVNV